MFIESPEAPEDTAFRKSLIDVLAGETALINANSDATAVETDVMLDLFRLLNIMGQLEADVVK